MTNTPHSTSRMVKAFSAANRLLFGRALPLILNLREHRALMKILSSENVSPLRDRNPELKFKYLRSFYLFTTLSVADGVKIINHHYRTISAKIRPDFFPRLFDEPPLIWQLQKDALHFGIRLTFPVDLFPPYRMHDYEGDFMLLFEVDSAPIYALCLTIVPSAVAKRNFDIDLPPGSNAIFIGRVQGLPGQFEKVRAATKILHDITAARLLINATEAIGRVFGAQTIVGVSNDLQLLKRKYPNIPVYSLDYERYTFDYNEFWESIGAQKTSKDFFAIEVDAPERPLEEIKQKHRSRTRVKRDFRKSVVNDTELNLRTVIFSS